jgi:hypothetical protein
VAVAALAFRTRVRGRILSTMKTTTFLPLVLGLAGWFLLAAMVGVTFQSKPLPAAPSSHATAVKPAPRTPPSPQLVMNAP